MSNDRYERIRQALAMGPTPGPWLFCPTNSGVFVKSERISGYMVEVRHCRTTQDVNADASFIAACDPDTIRELLAERDALAAENVRLREALRAIVDEVSEGLVPYSSDSYLPAHLVEQARAALARESSND